MKNLLIVGLGNPDGKHQKNRHNVGHMVVDALLRKGVPRGVVAKKTTVFMNNSGEEVEKLMENGKADHSFGMGKMENLYIVHDDLDIRLGEYKIQKGKGPRQHKGVESVEQALGTTDFWRIRVGVDNRTSRILGEEYVLQDFTQDERKVVDEVIDKIVEELA